MHVFPTTSDKNFVLHRQLIAELLALTVRNLFPGVLLVGGGLTSLGFYYDFIFKHSLTESMRELIDVHLHRLIREDHPLKFISMMRENAQGLFKYHEHPLLADLVGENSSNIVDLLQIGDFYGLCPNFSLESTHEVGYAKILESFEYLKNVNDEEVIVTRILGTSQQSAKDLKGFLKHYTSFLKKRDHRTLGPSLNLFSFSHQMGDLGVIWHSRGLQLRHLLQKLAETLTTQHVTQISTPIVLPLEYCSGDSNPLESFDFEGREYRLRSSLVRQHLEYLTNFKKNSEEFLWRVTEIATMFQHFPESQWWGLFCNCCYQTDQTTICCTKEQVFSELVASFQLIESILKAFSFDARWVLMTSRQKSSQLKQEKESIVWLTEAIQKVYYPLAADIEEVECDGPTIELRIRDVLGREWPASCLCIPRSGDRSSTSRYPDFSSEHVIITRKIWGSIDRFIALLLEQYEGVLPFWLVPEQVRVLVLGEANMDYAQKICAHLEQRGVRFKLDRRETKLGVKVHEAERENIPFIVLLGEQERKKELLSVRILGKNVYNQTMDLETFLKRLDDVSLKNPFHR